MYYMINPLWLKIYATVKVMLWGMVLTAAAYLLWSMKTVIMEAVGAVAAIWPGNVFQTIAFFIVMAGLIAWEVK